MFKLKGHLCFPEAWDLVREPRILDAAEDLIGPNILAFGSRFWVKPAGDGTFVSWHQDSAYFGCDPHDMITCWLALTPANRGNGCLRAMPGSHEIGHEHDESHENAPGVAPGEKKNMLGRGQNIPGLDESKAVHMELEQGQFSIHKERTAHASFPNNSGKIRIGYSFFLIPPHVKSVLERRPATLVDPVHQPGIRAEVLTRARTISDRIKSYLLTPPVTPGLDPGVHGDAGVRGFDGLPAEGVKRTKARQ